jgi:cold shock protein
VVSPAEERSGFGANRRGVMPTGKIKRLMKDRGFGFIRTADGQEIFFHQSSLADQTFEALSEGQEVEFEVEQSPKGPRANKVRLVAG